jgi:uncharacterized damage-inducible protein DinB
MMNWSELLKGEIEQAYRVMERLTDLVNDKELNWKPSTGTNWMTVGQLLMHSTSACGACCRGFVTGDWGFPEGVDPSNMPPEAMLPSADKLPSVKSVAEAKKLLKEDKKVALEMLAKTSEHDLAHKTATAPWDKTEMMLGHRLLEMVTHLNSHKAQLFYYLKLQGKPVNTGHLWGA